MANEIVSIEERIKQQLALQQEQVGALRSGGNFISFKNGNMKINSAPVPNNTIEVRILAVVHERSWYDGPYDPDTPQAPACYSFGTEGVPHLASRAPQAENCKDCPKNKWGSAPPRPGSTKPGRGKACREGARVVVCPAGTPIASAALYMANIPVTSLGNLETCLARMNLQTTLAGEYIVAMSVVEDKKTFFKVHFNIQAHTKDIDKAALLERQIAAMDLAMQSYPDFDDE